MIFIIGDTHIPLNLRRLNEDYFPEQASLSKEDLLVVCGDFGGVWDNSPREQYCLKWLDERPFTTVFLDGNHENFELLSRFPIENWHGGKIHRINESILHLMRGQVYHVNNKKIFVFGGGASIDRFQRIEGVTWFKEEIPSQVEKEEGIRNLDANNWSVDYVITHTAPDSIVEKYMKLRGFKRECVDNTTEIYLEFVKCKLEYSHWFCGHFHDDVEIDLKHSIIFNHIMDLELFR